MRRVISFLSILCVFGPAFAVKTRNLHYGEKSEPLFSDRKSTPALIVQIEEVLHYGYLTPGVVSGKLIIEKSPGERYSLTIPPSCAPGTYSEDSYIPCQPCGIGHYCTGGSNRQACTYGACSCKGTTHASDPAIPSECVGQMNKMLLLSEVNATAIPATNFSQWEPVACCNEITEPYAYSGNPATVPTTPGCANGTLGVGTYLFLKRYTHDCCFPAGATDSVYGQPGVASAQISVFDHPVGYKIAHGSGVYGMFVDLNNSVFTALSISGEPASAAAWYDYHYNVNNTNISGLALGNTLCIYMLK